MRGGLAVAVLAMAIDKLTVVELMDVLSLLRAEFLSRGDMGTANYIARAALAHADFSASPEAPSDNGPRRLGDIGADM